MICSQVMKTPLSGKENILGIDEFPLIVPGKLGSTSIRFPQKNAGGCRLQPLFGGSPRGLSFGKKPGLHPEILCVDSRGSLITFIVKGLVIQQPGI